MSIAKGVLAQPGSGMDLTIGTPISKCLLGSVVRSKSLAGMK